MEMRRKGGYIISTLAVILLLAVGGAADEISPAGAEQAVANPETVISPPAPGGTDASNVAPKVDSPADGLVPAGNSLAVPAEGSLVPPAPPPESPPSVDVADKNPKEAPVLNSQPQRNVASIPLTSPNERTTIPNRAVQTMGNHSVNSTAKKLGRGMGDWTWSNHTDAESGKQLDGGGDQTGEKKNNEGIEGSPSNAEPPKDTNGTPNNAEPPKDTHNVAPADVNPAPQPGGDGSSVNEKSQDETNKPTKMPKTKASTKPSKSKKTTKKGKSEKATKKPNKAEKTTKSPKGGKTTKKGKVDTTTKKAKGAKTTKNAKLENTTKPPKASKTTKASKVVKTTNTPKGVKSTKQPKGGKDKTTKKSKAEKTTHKPQSKKSTKKAKHTTESPE